MEKRIIKSLPVKLTKSEWDERAREVARFSDQIAEADLDVAREKEAGKLRVKDAEAVLEGHRSKQRQLSRVMIEGCEPREVSCLVTIDRARRLRTITREDTLEIVDSTPLTDSEVRDGASWKIDLTRNVSELRHADEPGFVIDTRPLTDKERQPGLPLGSEGSSPFDSETSVTGALRDAVATLAGYTLMIPKAEWSKLTKAAKGKLDAHLGDAGIDAQIEGVVSFVEGDGAFVRSSKPLPSLPEKVRELAQKLGVSLTISKVSPHGDVTNQTTRPGAAAVAESKQISTHGAEKNLEAWELIIAEIDDVETMKILAGGTPLEISKNCIAIAFEAGDASAPVVARQGYFANAVAGAAETAGYRTAHVEFDYGLLGEDAPSIARRATLGRRAATKGIDCSTVDDERLGEWAQIVECVERSSPEIAALLRHAVPLVVLAHEIRIAFADDSVFAQTDEEISDAISAAMGDLFDTDPMVDIEFDPPPANPPTLANRKPDATPVVTVNLVSIVVRPAVWRGIPPEHQRSFIASVKSTGLEVVEDDGFATVPVARSNAAFAAALGAAREHGVKVTTTEVNAPAADVGAAAKGASPAKKAASKKNGKKSQPEVSR